MRKPVGKRLLPPATVGALPLDSTYRKTVAKREGQ